MSQLSKKTIIMFIIIWIFLLGLTSICVLYLNKKNNSYTGNENNKQAYYNSRNYYSFYDDNNLDIKINYIDENKKNQNYEYLKISGLKNSRIENTINKELYNAVLNEFDNGAESVFSKIYLNAFNILSVYITSYYDGEGNKNKALNYDLNTGNKIKFEDLFTNTANVSSIIYDGVYNKISTEISSELLRLDRQIEAIKIYKEQGHETQWYIPTDINELKKERKSKEEELNNVEDLSLNETRKLVNDEKKLFYITNYGIIIFKQNEYYEILLKAEKNMEYFAYYEKYLNNKDLYKKNNIGKKNMFLSGINNNYLSYNRVEKIKDYALIDFEKWYDYNEDEISYLDKLVNEYKNKFDKNVFSYLNVTSNYYTGYNNSKIDGIGGKITICTMDKDYYNNHYFKELFTSKSEDMYASNNYYNDKSNNNIKCTDNNINVIVIDGHIYDKINDIFVNGFDYQGYLIAKYYEKNNDYYDELDIDKLKSHFRFGFTGFGSIYIDYLDNNTGQYFEYDESIDVNNIPKDYLSISF